MMKKNISIFLSLITCSFLICSLASCGNQTNSSLPPNVEDEEIYRVNPGEEKDRDRVHRCYHVCPTCQYCLNPSCSDAICAKKCDISDKNYNYHFEAEDSRVTLSGGTLGDLNRDISSGCVGNFSANLGASITFTLEATMDIKTSLIVSVNSRPRTQEFGDVVSVFINEELVPLTGTVGRSPNEQEWRWDLFLDVYLGCVNLQEGINTIKFQLKDGNSEVGFNVNYIDLYAKDANAISFFGEEEPEPDIPPIDNEEQYEEYVSYPKYRYEAENADESNGLIELNYKCDGDNMLIRDTSSEASQASNNAFVGHINEAATLFSGKYFIQFYIYADRTGDALLSLGMGLFGTVNRSVIKVDVNNEKLGDTGVFHGDNSSWTNWKSYNYGIIELHKGINTLRLTFFEGASLNLDYIELASNLSLS